MYLTAQRVFSMKANKTGVNAFLYRHDPDGVPGMSWDQPLLPRVADNHIGRRGPEHVEIAPGGNRVLSFIDIVTADSTPIDQVQDATRKFATTMLSSDLPAMHTIGAVAIRFGAQHGLDEVQLREEFAQIAEHALNLLEHPQEPIWQTGDPLEVDVEQTEDGLHFSLRAPSKARLAAIHGAGWAAPRVSISRDARDVFERARGDVLINFVPILAELELERVANLGGMRFYSTLTKDVLAEWPQR